MAFSRPSSYGQTNRYHGELRLRWVRRDFFAQSFLRRNVQIAHRWTGFALSRAQSIGCPASIDRRNERMPWRCRAGTCYGRSHHLRDDTPIRRRFRSHGSVSRKSGRSAITR